MKEATGELNMTVVTIVAVAAVGGLFVFLVWPMIQKAIANNACKANGDQYTAELVTKDDQIVGTSGTKVNKYKCCINKKNCISMD